MAPCKASPIEAPPIKAPPGEAPPVGFIDRRSPTAGTQQEQAQQEPGQAEEPQGVKAEVDTQMGTGADAAADIAISNPQSIQAQIGFYLCNYTLLTL